VVSAILVGFLTNFGQGPTSGAVQLFVSIQFDKSQYSTGEAVRLNGKVTENNGAGAPVPSAVVSVEVTDPSVTVIFFDAVQTGSDGGFSTSFNLGPSAQNGQYSAFARAEKPGYLDGMSSTNVQVIPEFPLMIVSGIIAALFLVVVARKRAAIR
jgi:uncharacterized protein YfaS (alpha-2-macroglobulin family)